MKRILILLIKGYQLTVSPLLPSSCKFHPTCSQYAMDALNKYGVGRGLWKALLRFLRCHPFGSGGYDPVT